MIQFTMLHPAMREAHLGLLPEFFSEHNPASARDQLDKNYAHGGGFFPMKGFTMGEGNSLRYPGDPEMSPLARAKLRDETILFYDHAIVAIVQPDGAFVVTRCD